MNKATVLKLKPGTWLQISWVDAPNSVGLLLAKPERERGDVSLRVFDPAGERYETVLYIVHEQVVANLGMVLVPAVKS